MRYVYFAATVDTYSLCRFNSSTSPIYSSTCYFYQFKKVQPLMGNKSSSIGLGQARVLCTMAHKQRLAFISEGLPKILSSAEDYWGAARQLNDTREGEVLQNYAAEEAAKILILMDIVRCPRKLVSSKIGNIIQAFYSHLARIIYAESMHWKVTDVVQLRENVDTERTSHLVEGDVGQFIFPNTSLFHREGLLYTDIMCFDNGEPSWNTPNHDEMGFVLDLPLVLKLTEAMSAVGLFTLEGLEATSEIWGQTTFTELKSSADNRHLVKRLLQKLQDKYLLTDAFTQSHFNILVNTWKIPMYDFDFSLINVSKRKLKEIQNRKLATEIGYDLYP